jgi:hypothetical protein
VPPTADTGSPGQAGNDADGVSPTEQRSNDPGWLAQKPDGIDFVGNSKISSFC